MKKSDRDTADGVRKGNYSIYRCLVFDTSLDGSSDAFHLSEGRWYRVDSEYLTKLTRDLDPYFVESEFPPRTEHIERLYCERQLVAPLEGSVLLDSTSIGRAKNRSNRVT